MSAFMSSTDLNTLREEGNERNCFVSLIVNNAGTYCAAITRKVQTKEEIVTKSLGTSYQFFGKGAVTTEEDTMSEKTEIVDKEYIEYFMLDIEKEEIDNPLAYLDERFVEIEEKKRSEKAKERSSLTSLLPSKNKYETEQWYDNDYSFTDWQKKQEAKQLTFWDDKDYMQDDYAEWQLDKASVKKIVTALLTSSLIVSNNFSINLWVSQHMEKKYKETFKDDKTFEMWADTIVDYLITNYCSRYIPAEQDEDECYNSIIYSILSMLEEFPENKYIEYYKSVLTGYLI